MQQDKIIQKNLFAINNGPSHPKSSSQIPEDLSTEELKKESKEDPGKEKVPKI